MKKYDHKSVEKKWQKVWLDEKVYEPDLKKPKQPFYNLMMFPYPSAEGLHVGNMYAFTGSDVFGRFKRMQGHDVFEPIGLDGFGIHSENYALKIGQHPMDQAKISERNFYRQLGLIGNGFAWDEKLETYDPEYYKWTQWIFIQLYKNGLAYRKKAAVNWCLSCLTVLADEQVISGECERCATKVIRKELEQWFFRITKYADRILKGLDTIDWSEKVKVAQRNWIGRSEGALIKFKIVFPRESAFLEVFTTRPDTLFGATYVAISCELAQKWIEAGWPAGEEVIDYIKKHSVDKEVDAAKEKTGVFLGITVVNPANNQEIPVWVADYVLSGYGTGAIMAVPAHDERDYEFAKKFELPIVKVIEGGELPYIGEGKLVNSGKFNGLGSEKAKWEITNFVGGEKQIQFRLRDWLISRQRYWGPPIPLVFCENCAQEVKSQKSNLKSKEDYNLGELENPGWVAVSEEDLPVELPYIKNFKPTGTNESPLASDEKFYKVKCPKCGGAARRETDVSDTFLDSAWYYLGYLILGNQKSKIKNQNFVFDKELIRKWCPVDMYIGGAEHSVLHLLYVRFLAMVFKDLGLIDFEEPFKKFFAHGLIVKNGAKMSKSKGNVVNPDEYIKDYGADALRMYLMFIGPMEQGGDFRDAGVRGITRFLERAWNLLEKSKINLRPELRSRENQNLERIIHKTIKKVTDDLENIQYNTAISALMILLNNFEENPAEVGQEEIEIFLKLLAPFAPHLTEEIWQITRKNADQNAEECGKNRHQSASSQRKSAFRSIHISAWPKYDSKLIKEDEVDMIVQVNGKMRAIMKMPIDATQSEVEKLARAGENVSRYVSRGTKKVFFVRNKIINFLTV